VEFGQEAVHVASALDGQAYLGTRGGPMGVRGPVLPGRALDVHVDDPEALGGRAFKGPGKYTVCRQVGQVEPCRTPLVRPRGQSESV